VLSQARIGLCYYSVLAEWRAGRMPIQEFVKFNQEIDSDGIEVLDAFLYQPGVVRDHLPEDDVIEQFIYDCLQSLDQTEQCVHAVCVTNDFNFDDEKRLRIERQKIEIGIEMALSLGAEVVRVFAGNPTSPDTEELVRYRTIDALKSFEGCGVLLALENHGNYFTSPHRLNSILEPIKSPHVGLCFDVGNFILAGVDPREAAQRLEVPSMIHIKDFKKDENGPYSDNRGQKYAGCLLGEGVVPIEETLKVLAEKMGPKEIIIDLELECGERGKEASAHGIKWMRDLIEQIQSGV
jgi:sugar phosphate isomerase/epimerase